MASTVTCVARYPCPEFVEESVHRILHACRTSPAIHVAVWVAARPPRVSAGRLRRAWRIGAVPAHGSGLCRRRVHRGLAGHLQAPPSSRGRSPMPPGWKAAACRARLMAMPVRCPRKVARPMMANPYACSHGCTGGTALLSSPRGDRRLQVMQEIFWHKF